jgi:TonB-linked SusC/RagA family outer membrane protein
VYTNGTYTPAPANYGANDTWNPLASAMEPKINNSIIRNNVSAYLEFSILEGLKLRVTGGALITDEKDMSYYNTKTLQGLQGPNGYGLSNGDANSYYQNSNILTYDKTFGKHHLTLTGVAEQQFTRDDASGLIAKNFAVDQTNIYDMGGAANITNSSSAYERVLNSYLGRVNYSYADKYLFTASFRADGASVFSSKHKWGYFPSMSAAWRLIEESFMKDQSVFSDLKLRGSWGITGNQAIAPYQTLAKVITGANYSYPYNGTDVDDLGYIISSAANPKLKWESTTQVDVGIDAGLFNNRLTVTVDYYTKTTKDLLLQRQLPTMTGIASVIDNVGSVSNKGVELSLAGDILTGGLKWNSGLTVSANRNKVLDIGASPYLSFRTTQGGYGVGNIMYLYKGQPFGQMYGYGFEGVWGTKDAAAAAAFGQLPGDPKYTDINHDGKINSQDLKVIGNAIPKYTFGWNNRFSYKDFDLNFLIQGTQGNNLFNMNRIRLEAPYEGTSVKMLDRWTPDHQNTNVPGFISAQARADAGLTNNVSLGSGSNQNSHYVENGSYVRMKNITLGYNLPRALISRIGFSRIRVYISAMNLFTITQYTGYDPESSSFTNQGDTSIGIDYGNYPSAKTYTAGLDISL